MERSSIARVSRLNNRIMEKKLYDRQWRLNNPGKVKEYRRLDYLKHKDRIKKQAKEWKEKNREKILLYWRKKHYEKSKESERERMKIWYLNNRQKALERGERYRINHMVAARLRAMRYRVRKMGAEGIFTIDEWEDLKMKHGYACVDCFRKEPEIKLEADHEIPLIKNGTNYIGNIKPRCRSCNARKGAKIFSSNNV